MDEARVDAVSKARARAELYARAAGLKVVRVLTISETGGWSPQPRCSMPAPKDDDVCRPQPGRRRRTDINASVTMTFELAPQ
jgi:uncharacterized protein YggE